LTENNSLTINLWRDRLLIMKAIETLRGWLKEKFGADLDWNDISVFCEAPDGHVWRANNLPTLTIHYATNRESWLCQAIKEEKKNLEMGIRKVTDPAELEQIRFDLDDDNWGREANEIRA